MDVSGANKRVLSSRVDNVGRPVKRLDPNQPLAEQPQDFALLEVTGGLSTGSVNGLAVKIGNKNFFSPTTVGFDTNDEAAAAAIAWQAAIDAASTGPITGGFGPGLFVVTNPGAPSPLVRIETVSGMPLNLTQEGSFDATTGLDLISGTHIDNAMVYEQIVALTGFPNIYSDGFALDPVAKDSSGSTPVVIRAELKNLTGGAVTAEWQIWWWFDWLGWELDQEVGTRSITEATGAELAEDTIAVSAPGATRIAVVLLGTAVGANLPAGSSFSAWGLQAT